MSLDPVTLKALRNLPTATLTTALLKRGIRRA